MRKLGPFVLGVVLVAVLLGFLVGASSSPIAGAAVTAVFSLLAASFAFFQAKELVTPDDTGGSRPKTMEARKLSVSTLNGMGWCLAVFCVAFSIGLTTGIWSRQGKFGPQAPLSFPWHGSMAPATIRVAVDWIALKRALGELGYSASQIEELYRMSGNGLVQPDLFRSHPDADLLSPILADIGKVPSASKKPPLIVDRPGPSPNRNPS